RLRRPVLYPVELRALLKTSTYSAKRISFRPVLGSCQQTELMSARGLYGLCQDFAILVGEEGFEHPTLCSQSRCATRLRHAPCHPLAIAKGRESYQVGYSMQAAGCATMGCSAA